MKRDQYLDMDEWTFDQSPEGWRGFPGSTKQKIKLIEDYICYKRPTELLNTLYWHIGQLAAFKGDYKQAIKNMKLAITNEDKYWDTYVRLTIKFIENDREGFNSILQHATLDDNPNKSFINKLMNGFDKSYYEAYSQPE